MNGYSSVKGAATLLDVSYTRDPVGNPLTEQTTGAAPVTKSFGYDVNDRLTSVCFQAGTCPGPSDPFIRYTYDLVGNRLSEARPSGTTSSSYDARDRLLAAGATSYTWDENGNQLSAGARTFSYDLANRLRSTTHAHTTTTYSYDGDSLRTQASTGTTSQSQTTFTWDVNRALPELVREASGANALYRRYVYGLDSVWLSTHEDNSSPSSFHSDPLGSVRALTAQDGTTQRTYDYEPFGQTRSQTGTSPPNLVKFAGEYEDPTGLYHLRARQYDPSVGRFLRPDPVGQSPRGVKVSWYAYVGNRPTLMVDPSGEIFRPPNDGRQYASAASSRWALGAIANQVSLARFPARLPAIASSPNGQSVAPLPPIPSGGCVLAITPPYLNEFKDQIEFVIWWRCSRVISVSVLGVLNKNGAIADSWSNWNPIQFSGEHTLKEKCRGDTARYQSFGSLSLRAFAWPPWRSTAVESGKVKVSC